MNRIYLRRVQQGFVPDTAEDWEVVKQIKLEHVVRAEIKNPRNLKFHRKFFALLQVGFEMWGEICEPMEHKGELVQPNFERFRRDVTILAGHYHPVQNIKGELRLEADSISFGSMDAETFEKLYNATLTVLVHKVMRGKVSEERLREMAESIEAFA